MSDMLTDEQLEELEKCRADATQGAWEAHAIDRSGCLSIREEGDFESKWIAHVIHSGHKTPQQGRANARFIAAANPEAVGKLIAEVKATRAAPFPGEQDGLSIATEFFEAMDTSGDREPLTPSAIACLLREYAADRRRRAPCVASASLEHSYVRPGAYDGEVIQFPDGTTLTVGTGRKSGRVVLPPESEWATFFERVWEGSSGTLGLKGGVTFLLKPKEKA